MSPVQLRLQWHAGGVYHFKDFNISNEVTQVDVENGMEVAPVELLEESLVVMINNP